MKYIPKIFITTLALWIVPLAMAQSTKLSLKDAIDYANQNHPDIQNKVLGEKYAEAQVLETRSIGIPQVSANVQFINNIEKQVFVFPINNVPTAIRVGNNYVTTATAQASWLAFDATYFLGLRAAEALIELAKLQTNISQRDVAVNVTKAYYLVLITKENIGLLEQNIKTLESVLFQTEGYYKNGFAEKLDVDRLKLTISNLNIQFSGLKDQAIITEKLLKLNMGMPIENPIELTDNLESLFKTSMDEVNKSFDSKQRIEYRLLQSQLTLVNLDKKRFEVSKYPNLAVFANYQQNNFGDKIDLGTWYGNSFVGFKIGVPIFSGFNNKAQLVKR
ncbi:MAG: TolC family protein, partial [Bacteroidia bacterium]